MTDHMTALRKLVETKAPTSLTDAIDKFRAAFPGLQKRRYNEFTKSHYASLDDVVNQTAPFLSVLDLRFQETLDWIGGEHAHQVLDVTLQWHDETVTTKINLTNLLDRIADAGPQRFGALLTYMRRYARTTMLGIAEYDDDSGGFQESLSPVGPMSDEQKNKIYDFLDALDITPERAVERMKQIGVHVDKLDELNYNDAASLLNMLKLRYERTAK